MRKYKVFGTDGKEYQAVCPGLEVPIFPTKIPLKIFTRKVLTDCVEFDIIIIEVKKSIQKRKRGNSNGK